MSHKSWSDYSEFFTTDSLVAGFTNIFFPYSSPSDRTEFTKILKLKSEYIVKPKQIHSNIIVSINQPGEILNVDGVITNHTDLILSIQVADCMPIFLHDKNNDIIGLVHAGWRGVSKGIINKTIEKLNELNSDLNNVKILLGPSIRQCCFEIGPEVATLFEEKYLRNGDDGRSYMDLQNYVIDTFDYLGVKRKNIFDTNTCTCCSNDYHSFRRDGEKAGRMIAMIGYKHQ